MKRPQWDALAYQQRRNKGESGRESCWMANGCWGLDYRFGIGLVVASVSGDVDRAECVGVLDDGGLGEGLGACGECGSFG